MSSLTQNPERIQSVRIKKSLKLTLMLTLEPRRRSPVTEALRRFGKNPQGSYFSHRVRHIKRFAPNRKSGGAK